MKKKSFYTSVFFLLSSLLAMYGQNKTTVKANIDKNSILIGERIQLKLEADIPENEPIRFFSIDTIDHFEFLEKSKIDSSNTNSGTKLFQQFVLTSFDSGQWSIPAFVLDKSKGIQTDSFIIRVNYTPFDASKPYHDIKNIIEVELRKKKSKDLFYIIAGALLILILSIYFLNKKKKTISTSPVISITAYEKAMKQLDQLSGLNISTKEYYTLLTDTFRIYLSEKINISSQQKTKVELVNLIREVPLQKDLFSKLSQTLRISDFVKFAKYQPAVEDDQSNFNIIKESIQQIENLSN